MLAPVLSREELTDVQGQLHILRVIETMPQQIEEELQTILTQEEVQRELKESYGRTSIRS